MSEAASSLGSVLNKTPLAKAGRRLTVVQILPDLHSGGVEVGTLELAQGLIDQGHKAIVISAGGPMVAKLEAMGAKHVSWALGVKSPLTFLQLWKLRRWFAEHKPDIIHARSRMPAWLAYLAWRGMDKSSRPRFVTTMHGLHSVSFYSEVMCKGERVIAVSQTVKDYIAKHYPKVNLTRISVVNRGVDGQEYPAAYEPPAAWLKTWHEQYPHLQGKQVICLPGRLTRLKGHHDFIALLKRLKQSRPNIHGLIVGAQDPKRKAYALELNQAIASAGLEATITLTGGRPDMREIYTQAAVVLSLSRKPESFGRTTTEALSMGVPVVAYDHGGVAEQLENLFPEGRVKCFDPEQLFQVVSRQLDSDARPRANTMYLKSNMIQQTIELYYSLLSST